VYVTDFLPTMLKHIFSPLRINSLELVNRVLMSSMHLNFEGEQQYERMAKFYALRAKNGPGLIVTAGCSPDAAGRAAIDGFSLDDDALIVEHHKITAAVHATGDTKIALQLLHCGRESFHGRLVAPSPLRLPGSIFTPAALTHEQILETVENYGKAAARALAAGYDAIELLFSQGFLIHQFLSPHTNLRTDEWGGGRDARMRFAVRVAESVRRAVGPEFPVVFRIPCMDLLERGLTFDDSMALIEALMPHQIDLLNISIGWHESDVPTLANIVPQAGFAATAAYVKQRFPQFVSAVSNRINDLRHGEELLMDGVADVIAMARPFLADREIVAKSESGRFDEINQCIACNQDCLDHMFLGHQVGCSVNPACGQPEDGAPPSRFAPGAHVAVIGGGLAGMSAALCLRLRGAHVTLYERNAKLGGQMLLAAKIPFKSEFAGTVRYYENRLRGSGVEVLVECEFSVRELRAKPWSHVVVATGTEPNFRMSAQASITGSANSNVQIVGWHDVLDKELPLAFPVVIYGGGGVACDIAKYLLRRQTRTQAAHDYFHKFEAQKLVGELGAPPSPERAITIVQRSSKKIGYRIGRTTRWITMDELERAGVAMHGGTVLDGVAEDGVLVTSKGQQRVIPARTLVMATGQHANVASLCDALSASRMPFSIVGAARENREEPASISSSIRSGYELAMNLTLTGCADARNETQHVSGALTEQS
jgi:2,4-dienoyl-CoA reductase (NADPH2)